MEVVSWSLDPALLQGAVERGTRDANWLALPGDITAAELGQVMRELGLNPSDAELRDLVNEADLNNDGVISFDGTPAPALPCLLTAGG